MRRVSLFLLLVVAACGGGGSSASGLAAPHVETQLLVMVSNPEDEQEVDGIRLDTGGLQMDRIGDSNFYLLTVPEGTDLDELSKELDGDLRVVQSEPNYVAGAPEGGPSDAPTFGDDSYASIPVQPGLADLHLPPAQALSVGTGVVVAVLDTGADFAHPFLAGHLAPGGFDFIGQDPDPSEDRNFFDDDRDGRVDEQYGHGTFVASLVRAVAPGAMILPVRILNDEGFGTSASVAAGIHWAVDAGAQVINLSLHIPNDPEVVKEAVEYAHQRGVLVVAASGNGGMLNDIDWPARYGDVVAVTAVDAAGVVAPFANRGPAVSLVAPGVNILGAVPLSLNTAGTARWSGTSFASPLVAGSAALVKAAFPALGRPDLKRRLLDTAVSVDPLNPLFAGRLGRGIVDPLQALQAP